MKIFKAADFRTRKDLEQKVGSMVGLTADLKDDLQITGTRAELGKLALSDRTVFWGIACRITDDPTVDPPQTDTPARGPIQDFGINGRKKKAPKKK